MISENNTLDLWACTVIEEITKVPSGKSPVLAAIDGRCGAGKTSLAARLQELGGYSVIHMDDFFLRPVQRTPERLLTPGENVDHERFLEEVLIPLSRGELHSYRAFDCSTMALRAEQRFVQTSVVIVEGSYSFHPALREYYDLKIFLDISPEEQLKRIVLRNGSVKAKQFQNKWIPLEEKYHKELKIREICDLYFHADS